MKTKSIVASLSVDSYIHLLFDTLEDAAALNLSNSDSSVSISLELICIHMYSAIIENSTSIGFSMTIIYYMYMCTLVLFFV